MEPASQSSQPLRTKQESATVDSLRTNQSIMAAASYLDTLNIAQRQAVAHGVLRDDCTPRSPLLVIAGAGSGKTNTLAHRVAQLIANRAAPRPTLLMPF